MDSLISPSAPSTDQTKPNDGENFLKELINIVDRFHSDLLSERASINSSASTQENNNIVTPKGAIGSKSFKRNYTKKKKRDEGNLWQSLWRMFTGFITGEGKSSSQLENITDEKDNIETEVTTGSSNECDRLCSEYLKKMIKTASTEINLGYFEDVIKNHIASFKSILKKSSHGSIQTVECLDEISGEVINFKDKLQEVLTEYEFGELTKRYNEFKKDFGVLSNESKFCLMCFAVFPKNAIVRKRLVENWLMADKAKETITASRAEKGIDEILKELESQNFIDPVSKKRRKKVNRFKMHPIARLAVIKYAESESPWCNWARLEGSENGSTQPLTVNGSSCQNYEELLAVVNVSEQFPDFQSNWFSKLKNIKVLYLGRWKNSANHFVDVQSSKFLKELKNMNDLRLLSLQGVYGIRDIPDSAIENLTKLRVLDLRCCYYLIKLPKGLASLNMLTYLDISECYLMEYMPKELASLSQLQVLKGFMVTDVKPGDDNICTLQDLVMTLTELSKLSIYVNDDDISIEKLLKTLLNFKQLRKLKIAWGAGSSSKAGKLDQNVPEGNNEHNEKQDDRAAESQSTRGTGSIRRLVTMRQQDKEGLVLEKLDLLCFPQESLPSWLTGLEKLRKLYIRGGRLRRLSGTGENVYSTVTVLRLRHLYDLSTNWRELKDLFPNVEYLEKFKCPMISLFPCDANGVWERRFD